MIIDLSTDSLHISAATDNGAILEVISIQTTKLYLRVAPSPTIKEVQWLAIEMTRNNIHIIMWSPSLAWQEVSFSSSTFWVQVHGLPELPKSPENIRKLGEKAGKVLEVDLVGNAFLLRNPFGSEFAAAGPWLRAENNAIPSEAFSKPNLIVAPVNDVTVSQSVPQGQRNDHCPQNDTVPQVYVSSQYAPQPNGHYASPQYQSTPQCTTVAVESSCHQQTSPPPHTRKPILIHSNLPHTSHNPQAHFSNPQSEPNTTPNAPSPTFPPGFGPSIEVTKNDYPTQKNIHPSSQPNLISTSPVIPAASTNSPLYQNTQEQIVPTSLPQTSLPLSLSSSQKNTHNNVLPQKRKNSDLLPRRVRKAKVVEERHIASSEIDPTDTGGLTDEFAAKAILAIPIPYNPKQDKLIWLPDSKGMFSVKSIHELAFRSSISNNPQNNHWKRLWNARLPERLKMLLWRIGVDVLPTKRTRNLTQFQEGKADIHKSKQTVLSRFAELSKTFSVMNSTPSVQPISAWTPPPLGWVKLNVDAALSNSKSALAVVARNHLGEILFIWGSGYHLCAPSQAEAAATLWAVNLAIQEHWKSVIIERDAQVCFNALSSPDFFPD
ncbi:hypothetical protein SO802_031809 [Lithocarpus litseifolius]|uniref:RNase H type-1 domain-containing protein n=1 Tax=Lithocarpus litseifolius TaxID=425828 RepID=A0AAW2BMK3_9ROSI